MVTFKINVGETLAGKYIVLRSLGTGTEGAVFHVKEKGTGVERAAKIFYPEKNLRSSALRFCARKQHALRDCDILTQYVHNEKILIKEQLVDVLISELVEGEQLCVFAKQKISYFEALCILRELARGLACIHQKRQYHGDVHDENILIQRIGAKHNIKLIDLHNHGKPTPFLIGHDVIDALNVFFEVLGGAKTYAKHPTWVKSLICGRKHSLIRSKFKDARKLLEYIDNLSL